MTTTIIARTAIEYDLLLLHNDHDFSNMEKVVPELKLYERHSADFLF